MSLILAEAQSVVLLSIYKPLMMAAVLGVWAWVVSKLDKDAVYYFLPRTMWNGVQMGAGALGFGLWLLIPLFWVGIFVTLLLLAGGIGGYILFRNAKVPAEARWDFTLESFKKKVDKVQAARAQAKAAVRLLKADGAAIPVPSGDDPAAAAHSALEEMLDFALPRKAERIDLSVAGTQKASVVVHIDGVPYSRPAPDPRVGLALINYVKQYADLDVEDIRRKQTGQLLVDADAYGRHTLGLSTSGSTRGLDLSLRIDPGKRLMLKLAKLGLLDAQIRQLEPVLREGKGVVLIACPPHQGMTTTLYSFLQHHDPYTQSVVTLEEEVAYEIEGVSHNTYDGGDAERPGVSQKVAALLRQDPQVLMLSRLADAATAKALAHSAGEVRIYAGFRQDDTFTALRAWVGAVGDPAAAAQALTAIVSQRLVRKLCPTCRVPYRPDPAALKKLNLPPDKVGQLFKQSGQVLIRNKPEPCPDCLGIAYQGRVAVFEVMMLDDAARQLVAQGQFDQLRSHLRKQKMLWLQEAALARVVEGVTSISEATRAMAEK